MIHVINNLVVGGAERFLLQLATAQVSLGWRVGLLTLVEPNPLACEIPAAAVDHHSMARNHLNDPRLLVDVRRVLARTRPDVVHTHLFYADFFGRLAARWSHVPAIVSTVHSTEGGLLSFKRRAGMRFTAGLAHRIVAVSAMVQRRLASRLSIALDDVRVIPNGISVEAARRARPLPRQELGIENDALLVGCVGRLVESKAYDDLLRAVARLGDARVQVVMAGDGPQRDPLRQLATELGIQERVRWLGVRTDVARILKTFDVFVLPSLWEGHSLALLEAMAAGCACIVSEIPELVDALGGAGIAVPPRNVEQLAAALRRLLASPEERRLSASRAQQGAERYSIGESAQRYVSLYNEILST